jgi:hypothetical protein
LTTQPPSADEASPLERIVAFSTAFEGDFLAFLSMVFFGGMSMTSRSFVELRKIGKSPAAADNLRSLPKQRQTTMVLFINSQNSALELHHTR